MCIEYVNVLETVVRADFDKIRDVPFYNWNNEKWDEEGPWTLTVNEHRWNQPVSFRITRSRERTEHPSYLTAPVTNNYPDYLLDWIVWSLPGLIVISGANVNPHYQGKGLGRLAAEWRVRAFDILLEQEPCHRGKLDLICRVNPDNEKQQHILDKVGWKQMVWTPVKESYDAHARDSNIWIYPPKEA